MSYWAQLWDALTGHTPAAAPPANATPARIAVLEMDLRERDERIAAMRKEYATLETAGQRTAAGAGADQLEQLFKKLAAPLSNLTALAAMSDAGREVTVADLLRLVRSVEKQLANAGLETIGEVGASVPFDLALHQRMSGGSVGPGATVVIETPAYRFRDKVLLKAMVTAKETGA